MHLTSPTPKRAVCCCMLPESLEGWSTLVPAELWSQCVPAELCSQCVPAELWSQYASAEFCSQFVPAELWSQCVRYLLNSKVTVYLLNSGVNVYLLNSGVDVAGVVVVGDVPAPVLGPRVEHHDVVFCPTNEEAPWLDDRTSVRSAKHAACHFTNDLLSHFMVQN